jgi:hypothetical protein
MMKTIIISLLLLIKINANALVPVHDGNLSIADEIAEEQIIEEEVEPVTVFVSSFNA